MVGRKVARVTSAMPLDDDGFAERLSKDVVQTVSDFLRLRPAYADEHVENVEERPSQFRVGL